MDSRERLASLAAPWPMAPPYECPTPPPRGEFETTAAFAARLTEAEQACAAGRRKREDEAQLLTDTARRRRAGMVDEPFILPLWNTTAAYDADAGVFLVDVSSALSGTIEVGVKADTALSVSADAITGNQLCAVSVPLAEAPRWRDTVSLFLRFRLVGASVGGVDDPSTLETGRVVPVSDARLVAVGGEGGEVVSTNLSSCLRPKPDPYRGVAIRNVMDEEERIRAARATGQFGAGAFRPGGDGVENPVIIRRVDPKYTPQAMRAKIQGVVELEAVVGLNGQLTEVRIHKSLDREFGLDDEAIKAAREWLLRPAKYGGKPVEMVVIIQMRFRLD